MNSATHQKAEVAYQEALDEYTVANKMTKQYIDAYAVFPADDELTLRELQEFGKRESRAFCRLLDAELELEMMQEAEQ